MTNLLAYFLGILTLAVALHLEAWYQRHRARRRTRRIQADAYRILALRYLELVEEGRRDRP